MYLNEKIIGITSIQEWKSKAHLRAAGVVFAARLPDACEEAGEAGEKGHS